jgi:alpha-L-fucosidase 2
MNAFPQVELTTMVSRVSENVLRWQFPVPRTHCGIPLGNGMDGILVWGGDKLHLTVNRADFWDHRQGEKVLPGHTYREMVEAYDPDDRTPISNLFIHEEFKHSSQADPQNTYFRTNRLPLGRFELAPAAGRSLSHAELDLATGAVAVFFADGKNPKKTYRVLMTLAIGESLLTLEDPDKCIANVSYLTAWHWIGDALRNFEFAEPEKVAHDGMTGWIQALPADPSLAAVMKKTGSGYLLTLARGKDNASALARAEKTFAACNVDKVKSETAEWWSKYWETCPQVKLPHEFFDAFFRFAHYKFACATNPASSQACALQGPWIEEYRRSMWSGSYTINVNIQQIYTLALHSGKYEHMLPLFDMLDRAIPIFKENARNLFGVDDALLIPHCLNDLGLQCGGISTGSVLDPACGGWMGLLYWQYYRHTGDKKFLRERALPFLRGILRCFEEMMEEHEGRLSIPVGVSAEYGCIFRAAPGKQFQNTGRDPSWLLACAHKLTDALLETAKILEIKPEPSWLDIKQRLPEFTLLDDGDGKRIAIWENQDLEICHRHHSHLSCVYPFDSLAEIDAETNGILSRSFDHWISKGMGQWSEWCMPWAALLEIRRGWTEGAKLLLDTWKEIFVNEGLSAVYIPRFHGFTMHRRPLMDEPKETTEVMQLEGTMAAATALYEMLAYEKQGVIHVFPAVPAMWRDLSFDKFHLPGGFVLSGEIRNRQACGLTVSSKSGGEIRLMLHGDTALCDDTGNRLTPGEVVSLKLPAGGALVLTAEEKLLPVG